MPKHAPIEMLAPAYVSRFACIGGDCEDTCCAGWQVQVDKDTFNVYQNTLDPELKALFAAKVVRHAKPTDAQFARITLEDTPCRECPFLTGERRCMIQERLGEQALSDTCATYPRTYLAVGASPVMALSLSCPEAARLALLEEDAFEFTGLRADVRTGSVRRIHPRKGLTAAQMEEVQIYLLQVLQAQGFTLPERLTVVGIFCQRLTALIQEKKTAAIPALMDEMDAILDQGAVPAPNLDQEAFLQAQAGYSALFFQVPKDQPRNPRHERVMAAVARGLGVTDWSQPDPVRMGERYQLGLGRLLEALQKEAPFFLDHFVLNEACLDLLPWSHGSPMDHFKTLAVRVAILRLMLAARAADQEAPLSREILVETTQVFARTFTHQLRLTQILNEHLTATGWDRMERLVGLL